MGKGEKHIVVVPYVRTRVCEDRMTLSFEFENEEEASRFAKECLRKGMDHIVDSETSPKRSWTISSVTKEASKKIIRSEFARQNARYLPQGNNELLMMAALDDSTIKVYKVDDGIEVLVENESGIESIREKCDPSKVELRRDSRRLLILHDKGRVEIVNGTLHKVA